jgi:hypothetical protein
LFVRIFRQEIRAMFKNTKPAFFFLLILLGLVATAQAKTVVLAWVPSPDPQVVGYKIYYATNTTSDPFAGTGSSLGSSPINLGAGTTATLNGLADAQTHYFKVTAYNAAGVESGYSNQATSLPVAPADTTFPVVGTFALPASASSLTVPVAALVASDNVGVTGYRVTTSTTTPTANAASWSTTAPTSVAATIEGDVTFYAWAKDAAGNVSAARSATVTIAIAPATYFPAPTETLLTASYSGEILVDGTVPGQTQPAVAGDEIAVFDPSGLLCGRTLVTTTGQFGPLTVYGDDPGTPADEGASNGETLTVHFWDSLRQKELPVRTLQLNGDRQTLNWSDGGGDTLSLLALAQDRIGLFRNGQWRLDVDNNGVGSAGDIFYPCYGLAGDLPVAGDWDGDGVTEIGLFRNGQWRLDVDNNGVGSAGDIFYPSYGLAGDLPVAGDWDGDGVTEIGLFRNGQWRLDVDNNGVGSAGDIFIASFGIAGDLPVVGDWNGDGIDDIGVYRNGQWRMDSNGNHQWDVGDIFIPVFGLPDDLPVSGVWW